MGSSDDKRKPPKTPRVGSGRSGTGGRPAGKGDRDAPHPRPGDRDRFGQSKDPEAPHPKPGGGDD